jgi:hypothetical protein
MFGVQDVFPWRYFPALISVEGPVASGADARIAEGAKEPRCLVWSCLAQAASAAGCFTSFFRARVFLHIHHADCELSRSRSKYSANRYG